jgi:hypothetical protein
MMKSKLENWRQEVKGGCAPSLLQIGIRATIVHSMRGDVVLFLSHITFAPRVVTLVFPSLKEKKPTAPIERIGTWLPIHTVVCAVPDVANRSTTITPFGHSMSSGEHISINASMSDTLDTITPTPVGPVIRSALSKLSLPGWLYKQALLVC